MFQLILTDVYLKRESKWLKKYPHLAASYAKTLKILEKNPFHPSLKLHRLRGQLSSFYAASINDSYRIVLEFLISEYTITLINVGDHDAVY